MDLAQLSDIEKSLLDLSNYLKFRFCLSYQICSDFFFIFCRDS